MTLKKGETVPPRDSDITAFHYQPEIGVDLSGDDQGSIAVREIAESLGITPEKLTSHPGAWIYLTEAVLAWFPGTHWQSQTEYNEHEHYRREGILAPLAKLLGIKRE